MCPLDACYKRWRCFLDLDEEECLRGDLPSSHVFSSRGDEQLIRLEGVTLHAPCDVINVVLYTWEGAEFIFTFVSLSSQMFLLAACSCRCILPSSAM